MNTGSPVRIQVKLIQRKSAFFYDLNIDQTQLSVFSLLLK